MKTLLIIDGHSLAHRGFHAVREKLTAPDGTPTSTIVAFMNMLYRAQDESLPDCTVAAFDAKGKTFRHEIFSSYKSERKPLNDDLRIQIDLLKELLPLCGIKTFALEGVEADDVVASAAKMARNEGWRVVILSSDKDLFQLLADGVRIIRPVKGGVTHAETYTEELFTAEYHFHPASMPDYLAIMGDKIDNVPGVDGIGDVGAKKLLSKYPTIEAIYASLDEIPKTTRAKLKAAGKESVIWTRDNLTLLRDNLFDGDTDFINDCMNWKMDFDGAEKLALRLSLSRVLQHIGSRKIPTPREFYHHEYTVTPDCDITTKDYKTELKANPEKFSHSPKVFDIHTAVYLLHPDEAAKRFAEIKFHLSRSETPPDAFSNLAGNLNAEISKYDGLHDVMTGIDMPLIPVLNKMEAHGIRIDPEIFASVQAELSQRISQIEAQILSITGQLINLNSSSQVSWLLYDVLKFSPSSKRGKTGYSTEAGVLERLAKLPGGQVPALILEHRELSKMLTSFVLPLQKAADNDGIIHTTFDPAMTGTGRLSSRDPNVQNLPAFGQWAAKIKSGLIPVNPDNVFVSADYSQVELRILAHMSQEERLIDAFTQGRDIHSETASWVFGAVPEFVTPEMRRAAKMINFGLIYGMGAFGLSERLAISRTEAQEIMTRYFDALPSIKGFIDGLIADAKERGYSRTLAGRIRPVNEIPAGNNSAVERALINSPIQGTAADIARKAVIAFDESGTADLFLQVHDSLVCECPESRADDVAESLRKVMAESGGEISILKAESKTGRTLANV